MQWDRLTREVGCYRGPHYRGSTVHTLYVHAPTLVRSKQAQRVARDLSSLYLTCVHVYTSPPHIQCTCTHMCTYTHTHTHSLSHTHAHTCAHTLTHMHTHAHTCVHTHSHTHTHTHSHTHAHTCAHTHTLTHTHTHTHILTHTHAHTCMHTHTHTLTHSCSGCGGGRPECWKDQCTGDGGQC